MILSDIGLYVQEHRQVTLSQISLHFNAQPDAVRGMLETWIKKGKISKQMATASCGDTCQQCDITNTEIYSWNTEKNITFKGKCLVR